MFKKIGDAIPISNIIVLSDSAEPKNHEKLSEKLKDSLEKAKESLMEKNAI
jgi:hypothetical protein